MPDFNAILAALANLPPPLSSSVPLVPAPAPPINGGPAFPQTEQDIAAQSVAPTAPTEPLDQNLIRQIMALAPPAPTAPAPLSRGQRIANALIGFGAGVQGNGPQFLEQLQQPQRQYQQQLANYNNERSRLGLTALETAQNKQERGQAERQRRADIQAQRDFEVKLDQMKFTNETARDQARNAFLLELQTRKDKEAEDKLREQQNLKFDEDLSRQIRFYRANGVSDPAQARRFALNDMSATAIRLGREVPPLTATDNKRLAKVDAEINKIQEQAGLAQARAQKALSGGGGAGTGISAKAQKLANEIQSVKDNMVAAEARGDMQTVKQLQTRAKTLIRSAGRYPQIEAGFDASGKWPYVKNRGAQPSAQPAQGQNNDPGDFRRY